MGRNIAFEKVELSLLQNMDNFDTLIIDELLVFNVGTALTLQEIVSDELRDELNVKIRRIVRLQIIVHWHFVDEIYVP